MVFLLIFLLYLVSNLRLNSIFINISKDIFGRCKKKNLKQVEYENPWRVKRSFGWYHLFRRIHNWGWVKVKPWKKRLDNEARFAFLKTSSISKWHIFHFVKNSWELLYHQTVTILISRSVINYISIILFRYYIKIFHKTVKCQMLAVSSMWQNSEKMFHLAVIWWKCCLTFLKKNYLVQGN